MDDFTAACWYWSGSLVSVIISLVCSFRRGEDVFEIFGSAFIFGMFSWGLPLLLLCFLPQAISLRGTGAGAWRTLP